MRIILLSTMEHMYLSNSKSKFVKLWKCWFSVSSLVLFSVKKFPPPIVFYIFELLVIFLLSNRSQEMKKESLCMRILSARGVQSYVLF